MMTRAVFQTDLQAIAKVHEVAFSRQQHSLEWLKSTFHAFPKNIMFVQTLGDEIVGYIIWAQKSGFRPEVILELEQIAVLPSHQNKGMAQLLIKESLELVKSYLGTLATNHSVVKHVLVSTRADNHAQQLYRKALGAKVEATLSNLYSADEVFMVARNV